MAEARAARRAICEYESGRLAACIPHAEEALSLLPEDRCWLRGTTSLLLATVQIHCGDFAAAAASIALLLARARATDNLSVTVTCLRRLRWIRSLSREARPRPRTMGGGSRSGFRGCAPGCRSTPRRGSSSPKPMWPASAGMSMRATACWIERMPWPQDLDDRPPADILEARACLQLARGDRQRALALQRQAALLAALPGKLDLGDPVVYRALLAPAMPTIPARPRIECAATPAREEPGLLRKEALHAALPAAGRALCRWSQRPTRLARSPGRRRRRGPRLGAQHGAPGGARAPGRWRCRRRRWLSIRDDGRRGATPDCLLPRLSAQKPRRSPGSSPTPPRGTSASSPK